MERERAAGATSSSDVLSLILRHGRTATAFRAVGRDLAHWFPPGHDAVVAYATPSGAMVAAGEPIAAVADLVPVAEAFLAHARAAGKRGSLFATEGRLAQSPLLRRWLIGEQPVWDPRDWAAQMATHRSLREQVRRARAKGVVVQEVDHAALASGPLADSVAGLLTRWRATRSMAAMQFLVTVDLTSAGRERRYLLAWHHGELAALLSLAPVPARNGWLFEHVLRDPDAPNGTLELLVDHMMRQLAAAGVPWATLGLAPLHGEVAPWLQRVRRWSTPLFNFEGLAAFKRKLRPSHWEPIYLAWPVSVNGMRALLDGLRAFAGGPLWRFGLRTILRGPTPLLLALEWLLMPWTIALALIPTTPWFPSSAVHAAWVAFDGALLLTLRHVRRSSALHGDAARAHTARIATGVALAVTVDALLTAAQAALWNASGLETALEWLLVVVACAAPALAAPMLWGAARRYRTLARARPRGARLHFVS